MLSYQDKLALMMTSAGSQRALAALIGASHQQVGRWLREGEPATIDPETGYLIHSAGAKKIPPGAHIAIDAAFSLHRQVTRDQARADGIPYSSIAPVFIQRGLLRTGQKGDRVFAENTHFIRADLRNEFLATMQQSKRFYQASVRSIINVRPYFERAAEQELRKRGRFMSSKRLTDSIIERVTGLVPELMAPDETMPLYTRYENISPGTRTENSLWGINKKLAGKHEPHAINLADQYLFQTLPQRYEKPAKRKGSSAKNIKSRK